MNLNKSFMSYWAISFLQAHLMMASTLVVILLNLGQQVETTMRVQQPGHHKHLSHG